MHSKFTGRDIATILTVSMVISSATVAADRILEKIKKQDAKIEHVQAQLNQQITVCSREREEIEVLRKQVHGIVNKLNR